MDSILARILLVIAVPAAALPFMIFVYPPLAKFMVGEYLTNIIRRNKLEFVPVILLPLAFLVWWGVQYEPWSMEWPWGEFFGVVVLAYGVVVGHFYWAGLRLGAIHRPTAWRCVEELRQHNMAEAAGILSDRLKAKGHAFQAPDRHGKPQGF